MLISEKMISWFEFFVCQKKHFSEGDNYITVKKIDAIVVKYAKTMVGSDGEEI